MHHLTTRSRHGPCTTQHLARKSAERHPAVRRTERERGKICCPFTHSQRTHRQHRSSAPLTGAHLKTEPLQGTLRHPISRPQHTVDVTPGNTGRHLTHGNPPPACLSICLSVWQLLTSLHGQKINTPLRSDAADQPSAHLRLYLAMGRRYACARYPAMNGFVVCDGWRPIDGFRRRLGVVHG